LVETYVFDEEFELKLLAFLVRDKSFYFNYNAVVKLQYFENQMYRDIYSIISEYYKNYGISITKDVLKTEILRTLDKLKSEEVYQERCSSYDELLELLFLCELPPESYTADVIVNHAKRQELKILLLDIGKKIGSGSVVDIKNLTMSLSEVDSLGSSMSLGYDYFSDVVSRVYSRDEKADNVVSTGFKKLNRYLGGGLSGGELGLVVGPPSRGKTATLVNISVGALLGKSNVIYFVLEGGVNDIAIRFDMRLSRLTKDEIVSKASQVCDNVTYFSKLFKSRLIIQMFPTESASVKEIDDFLTHKELSDGFIPNLIVIDYLNLCKRSNAREDIWIGRNYREGKALAVRRNKPVWSAVQAKMGALKNDVVTGKDIAEATGRIWADADVILGLCQSEREEREDIPQMRFYLGKNRNRAAKKVIPVMFNNHVMLIEEQVL